MGTLLILTALVNLYILSMPVTSNWLAGLLEPPRYTPDTKAAQAIVVLGSGLRKHAIEYDNSPTVNSRTLERIRYAAALSRKTGLPVLAVGGKVLDEDQPPEAEIMAKALAQEFNVPVRWQEDRSHNTAENALYSRQILQPEHIDRILLVTHAFHMQRAMIEFQRVGFTVQAAPTAYFSYPDGKVELLGFIPSPQALMISSFVLHEYLGMLWYKIRYS